MPPHASIKLLIVDDAVYIGSANLDVRSFFLNLEIMLRIEDAVRKMTSLNAAKLGITDRGILRPGAYADITLFDPKTVIDRATYEKPFAYNDGIEWVIVNGVPVLEPGGKHTGATPGRTLRRGH